MHDRINQTHTMQTVQWLTATRKSKTVLPHSSQLPTTGSRLSQQSQWTWSVTSDVHVLTRLLEQWTMPSSPKWTTCVHVGTIRTYISPPHDHYDNCNKTWFGSDLFIDAMDSTALHPHVKQSSPLANAAMSLQRTIDAQNTRIVMHHSLLFQRRGSAAEAQPF